MAENCTDTSKCDSCSKTCSSRKTKQTNFMVDPHEGTKVKKVIGVISGKGGVGKSMVTSLLASAAAEKGFKTGILDADITGPSIPKMFGLHGPAMSNGDGIDPAITDRGIKVMSINLLLEDDGQPVIWRGPVIAGAVKQFWTDVLWGELDYMFVDMPPGTGDVPLTVFQSLPVDGIVIVTSPQDLVSMIVEKAVRMAEMMNIPIIGVIENMSYVECPDCGKKIYMFGQGKTNEVASRFGITKTASLPVRPELSALSDEGRIEYVSGDIKDTVYSIIE